MKRSVGNGFPLSTVDSRMLTISRSDFLGRFAWRAAPQNAGTDHRANTLRYPTGILPLAMPIPISMNGCCAR